MSKYTTISGDAWDFISLKVYGSVLYVSDLIAANPTHTQTAIFTGGIELNIPEISSSAKTSANTPPWKS